MRDAPVVPDLPGPRKAGDTREKPESQTRGREEAESSNKVRVGNAKPTQPGGAGTPVDQPIGPLQRALKGAWRGYNAYRVMVKNLAGKGLKGEARERLLEQMLRSGASCFWIAGVLTVTEAQLLPFGILAQQELQAGRIGKGVSVQEALALLAGAKVALPIYWHNPDLGDIDQVGRAKAGKYSPGPLHVVADDEEQFAPHWLPIVAPLKPEEYEKYRAPVRVLREVLKAEERAKDKRPVKEKRKEGSQKSATTMFTVASGSMYSALSGRSRMTAPEPKPRTPDSPRSPVAVRVPAPVVAASNPPSDDGSSSSSSSAGSTVPSLPSIPDPAVPRAVRVQPLPQRVLPPRPPAERHFNRVGVPMEHIRPGRAGPTMYATVMAHRERELRKRHTWAGTFFDAAYGWEAPPCERRGPGGAITRWYLASSDESCRGAIQAKESFWRRLSSLGCTTLLYEARKEVLLGRFVCPGDWLYERDRGGHKCNPNLGAGGALRLEAIDTLECGDSVFELGKRQRVELPGGRVYNVAQLGRIMYVGGAAHWVSTGIGFSRDKVVRIGLRTQTQAELALEALGALPSDQSRVRALYSVMKPLCPDDLCGPLQDVRNEHLGQKEVMDTDPVEVLKEMIELRSSVRSRLGQRVPAFGHSKKRQPKSCANCGKMPEGKYRWKHRICTECRARLDKLGYTTYAGYQVQQNLHVPTCYPGIVKVHGEELPPKESKWVKVDTGPGMTSCPCSPGVKCDLNAARAKMSRDNAPKRWDDFKKTDLEKLKVPVAPRFTHVLGGIGCSGARPMVSARTAYNCAKALLGRVFLELPERDWNPEGGPKPGIWAKAKEFVNLLLPGFEAPRMAFSEWLETMPKRRRAALQRGWDRYERAGWLDSYASFTSFVKTELLPGFGKIGGDLVRLEEMLDRAIHGPSEESHCIAGPIVKPYVRKLKEIWGPKGAIFYGSCAPEKLHMWLQELVAEERQYFWCDFSMYDRTHSLDSWAFVESLYDTTDPMFRKVLDAWRRPRGRFGPLKYQAPVCNASGRDDTALANALLNGFATYLSVCSAWLRVPVEELTVGQVQGCMTEIRLSVCGDDSLGWLPLCSEERMAEFRRDFNVNIMKFGFIAKLCTSTQVDDCVYLGMRPYPTKQGWFWGKTIGRASYKMGWLLEQQGRDPMAHVTGIADMHVLCSSHVPVLSDLAKKIVELRQGARRTPQLMDPEKPWEWTYKAGVAYDDLTLEAVARVYSRRDTEGNPCEFEREVTVHDVRDLIKEIGKVERLPCVIDHWLWKHMVFSDDL